ncbi:MAG: DUF2071 domain-containing protein [Planctomycetaceae bacterium]|jgi:uncharacterized protein|nr:DUF2071 domain-containing protein [Planctomycetaceae bacterium]MBT6153173.1 DUF2071 domain-containing protein [Planctomycetaceae bacterium]MBT6484270.1 DUF2071 domain-containing protein [Planctomycetaceae bacterium]MBT6497445.1 DUF2071 domain-containing protein [Planctomycetaceae bacterium]
MTDESANIDRIAATRRPAERAIGYQTWSKLLFVHWRVSPHEIAELLPSRLTIDTFDGSAWIGMVPFHMSGVRPWWSPPVPGISSFHETNVRTYVHLKGEEPGVWFFSLDANSSLAVRIARWKWRLNYFRADMQLHAEAGKVRYKSKRLWPGPVGPGTAIEAETGDLIGALDKDLPAGQAVPGTLEHFLAERYVLYAQKTEDELLRGRVYHTPYPLREARLLEMEQTLLKESGIKTHGEPDHVAYSDGVDVEIFPLRSV